VEEKSVLTIIFFYTELILNFLFVNVVN